MHQNLWWPVGYNSLALPVAAGVFEQAGFVLRPEVGAISMAPPAGTGAPDDEAGRAVAAPGAV